MLDEQAEARVVRNRLETAVADWKRLQKGAEVLWGTAQLAETARLDMEFPDRRREGVSRGLPQRPEAATPPASGPAPPGARRPRVEIYGAAQMKARRDVEECSRGIPARGGGGAARADAEGLAREAESSGERRAFDTFDHQQRDEGERLWAEARIRHAAVDTRYREASQKIEAALALDVDHTSVREQLAHVLYLRILLAERRHQTTLRQELLQRLDVHDAGGVQAPARRAREDGSPHRAGRGRSVAHARSPRGRAREPGGAAGARRDPARRRGSPARVVSPLAARPGPRGSAVSGPPPPRRVPVSAIPMPRVEQVPEGFVYVPAGRFLFGAADEETLRKSFLTTVPEHQTVTGAFLIARRETTFGEWLDYLRTFSEAERKAKLLHVVGGDFSGALNLPRWRAAPSS